ncbi:MAG: hypothetical protein SGILL_000665 [Bacillariaceae sp.]
MNNSKKNGSMRADDQSATSTVNSAATSVLDDRIEKQRKGYNATSAADREAKERTRQASNKPGTYRGPATKLGTDSLKDAPGGARHEPRRSGSNREEDSATNYMPPRKPSRNNSKVVKGNVLSALETLEQAVLVSIPNTSPKARVSPKSLQNKDNGATKQLQLTEQQLAAKTQANARPVDASVSKRSAPSSLNRMEADIAAKNKARSSPPNGTSVKRLNRMEADLEAKNRAKASPSATATKRMNQMEADLAAKTKARSSPSSATTKRLNKLEDDVAAKAHAKASRDITVAAAGVMSSGVASPHLQALQSVEGDLLMAKNAARPGATSVNGIDSRVSTKLGASQGRGGSRTSRSSASFSSEREERIAFKTGIPLASNEDPEEGQSVVKTQSFKPENLSKMPEGAKDLHVVKKGQESALARKEYMWDMDSYDDDDEEGGRLAVAVAVKEYEDEDVFIPSAVEYDPDAKPPMYKNRRFRVYGLLGCILSILFLGTAIGILALQEQQKIAPVQVVPTGAPTCERCGLGIEEQLELEVGSEKLYDPSTAEYMAKEWIIYEDSLALLPMDANLVQRFLLAAFYFETHMASEWLSCNRQGEADANETCSFQRITSIFPLAYESVPGVRWLSSNHECDWSGVRCDELNQTRVIDLPGQEIAGTFPAVLTRLPYVQTLTLAWNNFTGQLPESIGNMKHLLNFEVQYNQFTGNIPLTWSNVKNLQLINFGGNLLSGQLPTEVGYLRNIKGMFLYENSLTGSFPDEFAQVSLLTYARFQRNMMSGTIPTMLADMRLHEFWIQHNPVRGTIPSELGKLSNYMFDLRLFNTELVGSVPEEIYDLTSLWRLDLHESNYVGTISTKIGNLKDLSVFRINDNRFTGTLPTELSSLPALNKVNFSFNRFNGTVPSGMCDIKAPNGTLKSLEADCLANPISGLPLVTCECCDSCCSPESEECAFDDAK